MSMQACAVPFVRMCCFVLSTRPVPQQNKRPLEQPDDSVIAAPAQRPVLSNSSQKLPGMPCCLHAQDRSFLTRRACPPCHKLMYAPLPGLGLVQPDQVDDHAVDSRLTDDADVQPALRWKPATWSRLEQLCIYPFSSLTPNTTAHAADHLCACAGDSEPEDGMIAS